MHTVPTRLLVTLGLAAALTLQAGCASDPAPTATPERAAVVPVVEEPVEIAQPAVVEPAPEPAATEAPVSEPAEVAEAPVEVPVEPAVEPAAEVVEAAPEPAPATGDKHDLRLKLAAGSTYGFTQKSSVLQNIDMQGMELPVGIESNQAWKLEVVSVGEDGIASVRIVYGRVWGSMDNPMMGVVEFDSDVESEADPMTQMTTMAFTAMADAILEAKVDPWGKAFEVTGFDAVIDRVTGGDPMMKQMIQSQLNEGQVVQTVQAALGFRPKAPVAAGESWDAKTDAPGMPGGMAADVKIEARLEKVVDGTASLSWTGTMKIDLGKVSEAMDGEDGEGSEDGEENPMAAAMKDAKISESRMNGHSSLSMADGLPLESTSETFMRIENMGNPMMPEMKMNVDVTITVTVKREAAAKQ